MTRFLASAIVFAASATMAFAQTVKVEGLIKGRSGSTIILQTAESPKVIVLLDDRTEVGQVEGALKVRRKAMSAAALIPGLAVQVEGSYNAKNELMATVVKFKGDDLKQAQAIEAGMKETQARTAENEAELAKQKAALEAEDARLRATQTKVQANQAEIEKQKAAVAANRAAIEANTRRFGQLDDYYIHDEVVVLFGNGKVKVEPQYKAQLVQLAQKAKTVNGYMIQAKGFASASGSAALNQKLSEDRAHNVVTILLQDGRVPLVNMLAPGAMGEAQQVQAPKSADAEAQNRRVVVRVLQNKGVAGL